MAAAPNLRHTRKHSARQSALRIADGQRTERPHMLHCRRPTDSNEFDATAIRSIRRHRPGNRPGIVGRPLVQWQVRGAEVPDREPARSWFAIAGKAPGEGFKRNIF